MRNKKNLKFRYSIQKLLKWRYIKIFLSKIRKRSVDGIFKQNAEVAAEPFEILEDSLWANMKEEKIKLQNENPLRNNPFYYTKRISFELSNLCNYSNIHKKCPLHLEREVKILPLDIIKRTIDVLSKYQFAGTVAFHNYNEPLIDPRLFALIEYTKKKCPHSNIYICTNGFYFDQTIGEELESFGVSKIHISIYSRKELERLKKVDLSIPCELEIMKLDNTLNIYSGPILNLNKRCLAPLNEIIITRDAEISLCCFDWAHIYTYGNLKEKPIDEILSDGFLYEVYKKLSNGKRFLNICKNCKWAR